MSGPLKPSFGLSGLINEVEERYFGSATTGCG